MSRRSLRTTYRVGGAIRRVDLRLEGARLEGSVDGVPATAEAVSGGPGEVLLRLGGRVVRAVVARRGRTLLVSVGGRTWEVAHEGDGAEAGASSRAEPFALAPMTGVVANVHARAGASVAAGDPLFSVEAMKMEYVVRAERAAVVAEVRRAAGERVAVGDVVVAFREEAP